MLRASEAYYTALKSSQRQEQGTRTPSQEANKQVNESAGSSGRSFQILGGKQRTASQAAALSDVPTYETARKRDTDSSLDSIDALATVAKPLRASLSNFNTNAQEYQSYEQRNEGIADKDDYLRNMKLFIDPYEEVKKSINSQRGTSSRGKSSHRGSKARKYETNEHLDFGELY